MAECTFDALFPATDTKRSIILLDGGLGTLLESDFSKPICDTPLWSAQSLSSDPETHVQAYLAFLGAGAQLISTPTYQCSFKTFRQAGYTDADAVRLMHTAVQVTLTAKLRFCAKVSPSISTDAIKIALSLGPFGATLIPMQDYDGIYPPPYGPPARADHPNCTPTTNAFSRPEDESHAERALTAFHLERLIVFAHDEQTWASLDCIAFETIPLAREVRAIRRAIDELSKSLVLRGAQMKPWWISMVFPGGRSPQMCGVDNLERVSPQDVFRAALEEKEGLAMPTGVGVNCTATEHLPALLRAMEEVVHAHHVLETAQQKPWLLLYPNRDEFSLDTKMWKNKDQKEQWADGVVRVVLGVREEKWGGIIVGGCCRAGPREIKALAERLREIRDQGHHQS